MTLEERIADEFKDYRYGEEFIERAKLAAIESWNNRVDPAPPAPIAVVMPERKTKADYSGYIEQFQSEAAGIYNSALAEVARLNGVKP